MTDDLDRRLAALFDEPVPALDEAFAHRIVALARYDSAVRDARRRAFARVGKEALALFAVGASFVFLAQHGPDTAAAGLGDSISLGSPAMLGMLTLLLGSIAAARTGTGDRGRQQPIMT